MRLISGICGTLLTLYFGAGTIGNAIANQSNLSTWLGGSAGILLGIVLLTYGIWGARPGVGFAIRRALITGVSTMVVGGILGLVLLSRFYDGVEPHLLTSVILVPALFIVGCVAGGASGLLRGPHTA